MNAPRATPLGPRPDLGRPRRRRRRTLAVFGGALTTTVAMIGLQGPARAELVPCDPIDCPTGPVYAPLQVATGLDRDFDTAEEEAEDQAAAACPYSHTFDVVRVHFEQRPGGRWEYTLTYRCESPQYDPWP